MNTATQTFNGIRCEDDALKVLNRKCNDGRMWLVSSVFDVLRAEPLPGGSRVPRWPAGCSDFGPDKLRRMYWQNGAFHPRRPPTKLQEYRAEQAAYFASGVRD